MTTGTKWLLMGLALLFIFTMGAFTGLFLLIWIIVALVMLFKHNGPAVASTPAIVEQGSLQDVAAKLQLQIEHEENPDVREGLSRALELVDTSRGLSSFAASIPLNEPETVLLSAEEIKEGNEKATQPLDQTAALLYIGSLLFVGGMGLFIVYGGLSNVSRLVLIVLLAALLYIAGLVLYTMKESLRPAAVTFLAISLVLIPLAGYAAVYLLQTSPDVTWLVTSIIGLIAYLVALFRTRAEIVSYVVYLAWLSLIESAANLFGASVVWFVWTAYGVGILTQLLVPSLVRYDAIVGRPLWWSSMALAPLGLFASLVLLGNESMTLWQFGITLLLAGAYYASCIFGVAYAADKTLGRQGYAMVAHTFVVAGALVLIYDKTELIQFGAITMLVALLHVLAWVLTSRRIEHFKHYEHFLYLAGMALSVFAWLPVITNSSWLATGVWLTITLGSVLALLRVRMSSLLVVLVASMIAPLVSTPVLIEHAGDLSRVSLTAISYFVLFVTYALLRHYLSAWSIVRQTMIAGYIGTLAFAWLFALWSGDITLQLSASVAVAAVALGASYYERAPSAVTAFAVAGFVSWYLILSHNLSEYLEFGDVLAYALMLNTLVCFMLAHVTDEVRARIFVLLTLMTGLFGWFLMLILDGRHWTLLGPVWLLAMAGVLVLEKPRLNPGPYFALLPVGMAVLAVTEYLARLDGSINWLVYTHMWTGYLVYVIYMMKRNIASQSNIDIVKFLALGLFTLPVVLQALIEGEAYNMLLLAEQVALLLVGVATGRKYITKWATIVIILVIVYMLRSFGYLQLVIIALSLISYALYRLGRKA